MKTIKILNTFAIGLPFALLISYPFIKQNAIALALISTMLTGFLQFLLGIKMLVDEPKNKNLKIYVTGVVSFFSLWMLNYLINFNNILTYSLVPIPLLLAIYLSVIIYKKATK